MRTHLFSLATSEGILSARELNRRVQALSQWLLAQGLQRGQIMAISGPLQQDYLCLLFAAWQVGLITLPLNPRLKKQQLQVTHGLLELSIGELVLCPARHWDWADLPQAPLLGEAPAWQAPALDQPLTLILSSGSSGPAKLVQHSWGNHLYSARGSSQVLALEAGDRWHLALPLYHVGGLAIVIRCLLAGAQVSLAGTDLAEDLAFYRPSHLSLVATQLYRLMALASTRSVLQSARAILLGGSAIPRSLIIAARQDGLAIHCSYGSTEMASQISTTPADAELETLFSAGFVLPFRELCLSTEGEVWLRGHTLCQGYRSESGLESALNGQGWFASGDRGEIDSRGRLHIIGRRDQLIISGGENIQPEAIEAQLLQHPEVAQAIVVGVADAEFGQRPVAFVQSSLSAEALLQYLKPRLPGYAIPDYFYTLPAYQSLKPSRKDLQELAQKMVSAHKT